MITIEGTLALDSAGTQVDNLGLSSNTLPVTGVFSFEPDLVNNDDLASFTPGAVDLTLQKSRLETGVLPVGQETTFRLVVTNDGTVATTGVRVTDELPAGLTPVGLPAGCTANGQTVTCDVATLGPGRRRDLRHTRARRGPRRRADADESRHRHKSKPRRTGRRACLEQQRINHR